MSAENNQSVRTDTHRSGLFSIPAGIPFARALAAQLLFETQDNPENLSRYKILLPTRRACRTLQESFLRLSEKQAVLLPRLQPLGDVDEDELSLSLAGQAGLSKFLEIPPAMPPLQRQILLARLIAGRQDFTQGFDRALALAAALGYLMDQIHTEGLDMADMAALVPNEFASHWQITLRFLEILSIEWPKILAESGLIEAADRRNRLMNALSDFWEENPPEMPVIAAGSTGSIPATGRLLGVIAGLPQGRVVLPGLDTQMDTQSWDALEETHPQFGLKQLLERIAVSRQSVKLWPAQDYGTGPARRMLASEIMRPAATSARWMDLGQDAAQKPLLEAALAGISLYECDHERDEAELIALLMRETLETPGKTAALVTPSRTLAQRVRAAAKRWNIALDDSAGRPLSRTQAGTFALAVHEAARTALAPVALLSLLKHPLCRTELDPVIYKAAITALEKDALRGMRPAPGLEGLAARLGQKPSLLETLETALGPLCALYETGRSLDFGALLDTHLRVCEALCTDPALLWSNEDGRALAGLFTALVEQAPFMPAVTPHAYGAALEQLTGQVTIRPSYGMHPRLMILGQLEARLIEADFVILGGLNEGTWPPETGHDPFMSRPMRRDFGLPTPERAVGLAAHDFTQGLCMENVALTRSRKVSGAQSVPARWLQRLDTILEAAALPRHILTRFEPVAWAKAMDHVTAFYPAARPAPRPPLESRPRRLSVTKIETWLKDPYAIYARHILKLTPLDDLDKQPDAALYGQVLHAILDQFARDFPDALPDDAANRLEEIARAVVAEHHDDPALWSFWWPRFSKIAHWLAEHEKTWRGDGAKLLGTEIRGEMGIQTANGKAFTLSAIADRIDRLVDGQAAIIDYKSGGTYSQKGIKEGGAPQLPLEALILSRGGFGGLPAMETGFMGYWILTGGTQPGDAGKAVTEGIDEIVLQTETRLKTLIDRFDDPQTPYLSLPRPDKTPRFNDYEHLARVREWSVLDSAEDAA
ncbi:MAG: double-strand break repair protein AddB [Alphaproteobacteria bacterium]|nr:double-strand break repair protein AddB [Alphaproteobacteria bacterium]